MEVHREPHRPDDKADKARGDVLSFEFAWQEIKETDPEVQTKVETEYVKFGVKTPNESRDTLGLDAIKRGDDALLIAGATIALLKDVEKKSDNAT